jgi:putative hydrolase of the HAD superfamily
MITSAFLEMIHNLIFDFGGVLINLDMEAVPRGLRQFGRELPGQNLILLSQQYEKGLVTTNHFLEQTQKALKGSQIDQVREIWNQTIADFPVEHLDFLEKLKATGRYRMYLLSNTNALHMEQVRKTMGMELFDRFHSCFKAFYLSHEVGMRKPDPEIFQFVLDQNGLLPEETLFIDDTREHTQSAAALGIETWHFRVGVDNILQLHHKLP